MTEPYERGMKVGAKCSGTSTSTRAIERTTEFTADFQDLITRYAWGEIWSRPGLDRRTRSCITLTALVALGREEELAMHVRAALRIGLTPDEIKEVLLQSAIYCGVPAANGAFAIAQTRPRRRGAGAGLMRTQVGIVGAGPGGPHARTAAPPRGHRVGRARGSKPRLRRAPHSRRRARAGDRRSARRRRRRRAHATRGDRPPRHRAPVRRRAPPDPAERAHRRALDRDLRPDGGREGSDRRAPRSRRCRCSSRSTTSAFTSSSRSGR